MACAEITNAINWAKQSTGKEIFPVTAFLTKHTGVQKNPNTPTSSARDFVWYAVGPVSLNAAGHLVGDLQLYMNSGAPNDGIVIKNTSTAAVDIFPDGSAVTYQQKLNGAPVGGMPPIKVTTTCLMGMLLTGINQNEVIAVGVRLDPSYGIPS